jgi:S1-C subfamily serine protease
MLHAWEKYGLPLAELEFRQRYDRKNRNPKIQPPSFQRVLKGKLDYLTMIRGIDDSVCIRLLRRYARLSGSFTFIARVQPRTNIGVAKDAVWILEELSGEGENMVNTQGTGFFLHGVGLVTCAHVLTPGLKAFRAGKPHEQYKTKVLAKDNDVDLAILEVLGVHHDIELLSGDPALVQQSAPIRLLGFPNYAPGQECSIRSGEVIAFRPVHGVKRLLIDANIITGNSGGPVLDKDNRVIGVAAKGSSTETEAGVTDKHEVIPIDALKYLQPQVPPPGAQHANA